MAETKAIKAVELVREIRDEQAAALAGKSEDEVLAFFHRAAEKAREDARRRVQRRAVAAAAHRGQGGIALSHPTRDVCHQRRQASLTTCPLRRDFAR